MKIVNNFLLDVYDAAQHCTALDFNEYALNGLRKIVHFDSAVLAHLGFTQEQKFSLQSLHLQSVAAERFQDRSRIIGAEKINRNGTLSSRDSIVASAFAQRGRSVTVDIAKQISSPDILRYCRKYETAHSLAFVSAQTMNGLLPSIGLWRAAKKNAYLEVHAEAATLVLPHVFQAMAINRRLAVAPPGGRLGTTAALANLDGLLYFVEPETIRLLQLEWKQWSPPLLPGSLMDSLKQNSQKTFTGSAICVTASVRENMICLLIVARESQQKTGLTAAEYRVAKLAAEGLQYKEIAKQLELSPATVRNQLHSVYGKLGVANKTALAAVLPP